LHNERLARRARMIAGCGLDRVDMADRIYRIFSLHLKTEGSDASRCRRLEKRGGFIDSDIGSDFRFPALGSLR
jgi:hypothetical protein